MAAVHTLSSLQRSQPTAPPTLHLFPTTTHIASSPFAEVQSGPTRTDMPTFKSLEEERQYRKEHLALTFRVMHRQGLAEGVAGKSPLSACQVHS